MAGNNISGKTRICGVIGDPIGHTASPAMHNAAFEKLGLDYLYIPFKVKSADLARAVDGLRALNVAGFNVTIPHKVAIIPLLDELDPLAQRTGAVNTVTSRDDRLRGSNTDAEGFLRALLAHGVKPGEKNAVILGAGGAARAIAGVLAENGARITILNRRQEMDWAVALARKLSADFPQEVAALELGDENLSKALDGADILINATSAGMSPRIDETPVPARWLKSNLVVFDIVYNPPETRLLKEAQNAGAKTIGGVEMLAWQGALAFEQWTGQKAPLDLMRKAAVKALRQHEK